MRLAQTRSHFCFFDVHPDATLSNEHFEGYRCNVNNYRVGMAAEIFPSRIRAQIFTGHVRRRRRRDDW